MRKNWDTEEEEGREGEEKREADTGSYIISLYLITWGHNLDRKPNPNLIPFLSFYHSIFILSCVCGWSSFLPGVYIWVR